MRKLILTLLLLLLAAPVYAANIYVNNSCPNNGTGLVDSCAGSPGGAGRYNDLQSALTAAVAGDIIIVAAGSGDYVTTTGSGYSSPAGFQFANSGTVGNPITLRNKTGERPVLRACTSGSTTVAACDRATITAFGQSYISITSANCPTNGPVGEMGLNIYGLVIFYDDSATEVAMSHGNTMTCTEVQRGYSTSGDGNWSTLWLQGQYAFTGRWNYFHDVTVLTLTGAAGQSSRAGLKLFQSSNSTFSDNTIENVIEEGGEFGVGIDCKADCVSWTMERNNVKNVNIGFRLENQETLTGPYNTNGATGTILRYNVFIGQSGSNRPAFRLEDGKITDILVYNNTWTSFTGGLIEDNHSSANICQNITWYNNATHNLSNYNIGTGDGSGTSCTLALSNYNAFTTGPGTDLRYTNTNYAALANWQAGTGFDANSIAQADASFLFTSSTDFTLQGGSPLKNAGKTGGTGAGATVDIGAYATTTCVGHLCGSVSGAPAPTVSSINPSSGTTAGGTSVTITGTNFVATPAVNIGAVSCTGVHFTSSTQVECTTGARAAATVDVVLTNPDAQSGTLTNGYTYTLAAPIYFYLRFR